MNLFQQFSLVMRSSATTLKDKLEDPERILHQLIIDMQEELDRVRGCVAEAVADEIQMRQRAERQREEAAIWADRAKSAIQRGDESTAKAALDYRLAAADRADKYASEHERQHAESEKLQASVRDLEDRIRQAKQKKTLLTARLTRAKSSQRIASTLDRTTCDSAFAQFQKMEDRVDREEAMNQAWQRMDGKDPDADELARQFEAEQRQQRLAEELESLKSQVSDENE